MMKKFGFVVAAVAALAFAAPIAASAQTVVIKSGERGMHRHHSDYRGARAYMHRDRGWHRGHNKKVIVIKRGHGYHHHR